jgi:AbrB family looped-hinge helix DNA binding protein
MPIVKVQKRGQVTIPAQFRVQVGIADGDLLEARCEHGQITFTPKSLVDREIAEGLEDLRSGRTYGPFDSAQEMIRALRQMTGKGARKIATRK